MVATRVRVLSWPGRVASVAAIWGRSVWRQRSVMGASMRNGTACRKVWCAKGADCRRLRMAGPQLDLFGEAQPSLEELLPTGFEPPPADFVQRIRGELEATLVLARGAAR